MGIINMGDEIHGLQVMFLRRHPIQIHGQGRHQEVDLRPRNRYATLAILWFGTYLVKK